MISEQSGRRWTWTLLAALAVAGCAPPLQMQVAEVPVASRRLAALPSYGTVFEFDYAEKRTLDRDGTTTAAQNVDDAIGYRLRQHGGRSFRAAALENLPHDRAFRGWAVDSMSEIMAELLGHARERHETVGDWRFTRGLGTWRAVLDADFVLVSLFIDGHNTIGREALVAFGGGRLAARRAIACVVHLESARIVWCNFNTTRGELMHRAGAQDAFDSLLGKMLLAGDSSPVEPPPSGPSPARATPAEDPGPPPPSVESKFHAP